MAKKIEPIFVTRRDRLREFVDLRKNAPQGPRKQKDLALRLSMSDKQFAQLVAPIQKDGKRNKGWRPINDDLARQIESEFGMRDKQLDGDSVPTPEADQSESTERLSDGLAESRKTNNLLAVWYALEGMANFLHRTQPETGADVARDVVAVAGVNFSAQGFVNTLVARLLGAEHVSVKDLNELLRRPVSSGLRRGAQRVK